MKQNSHAEVARTFNNLSHSIGRKEFMTTIFSHPNGFYYDPLGDEIFEAKRIGYSMEGYPIYQADFGDETKVGVILDHGYHVRLEE